ncbi:MAG: signal peptidase II [Parasphingorhabdus sp.]|nr:signal peptidase II [Parasphingorhabdus sp.]
MTQALRTHRRLGIAIAAFIFLADQVTKFIVTVPLGLQGKGTIDLFEFFDLTWTQNYGVSLGFLTASSEFERWALVALTAAIAVGVVVWMWREQRRGDIWALGLVLGGAAGNILDRARLGYVVDFADLHFGTFRPFLIFNVADAAISIGVVILLARALFIREKPAMERSQQTGSGGG